MKTLKEKLKDYEDLRFKWEKKEDYKEFGATYDNMERLFAWENIQLKNIVRDSIGNDGDDGGYIVALGKKADEYYLYVVWTCYEGAIGRFIVSEEDSRYQNTLDGTDNGYVDFVKFSSLEAVQVYIEKFVADLDMCYELSEEKKSYKKGEWEFYGERPEDFIKLSEVMDLGWSKQYASFLDTCSRPYSSGYWWRKRAGKKGNVNKENLLSLAKVDKTEFLRKRAKVYRSQLLRQQTEKDLLIYKVENPEYFEIETKDIELVIKGIQEMYCFTSEDIRVDLSFFSFENLFDGTWDALLVQTNLNTSNFKRTTEAVKSTEDAKPEVYNKGRTTTIEPISPFKKTRSFSTPVTHITIERALDILFGQYEQIATGN